MNKTTEALKMAIEALENLAFEYGQMLDYEEYEKPYPSQTNESIMNGYNAKHACKEALDDTEARDKARAWLDAVKNGKPNEAAQLTLQQGREIMKQMGYTHPAQPLSDDEINAILVNHDLANVEVAGHYIDVVLLMRDVEQAHGIK